MAVCNMALDVIPDPGLNWQAYCMRAKVSSSPLKQFTWSHSKTPGNIFVQMIKVSTYFASAVLPNDSISKGSNALIKYDIILIGHN